MNGLQDLGWTPAQTQQLQPFFGELAPTQYDPGLMAIAASAGGQESGTRGLRPARILCVYGHRYILHDGQAEYMAVCTGRFQHQCGHASDYPAVGDWVLIRQQPQDDAAQIHHRLERNSWFARKQAGQQTEAQIVAANLDKLWIVSALNKDLNLRRIERYLVSAWESHTQPVVVLTKSDLCAEPAPLLDAVQSIAMGVPIHVVSALEGSGLEALREDFRTGHTVAMVGSSGVGKSTLLNTLLGGAYQAVQEIRDGDDKGRHTTTARRMFFVPGGGLLIDTPGMRELQLWDGGDGLQQTFEDIEALVANCRFHDCQHQQEPGCAVQSAVDEGVLAPERLESYQKLQRELAYLERKQDHRLQNAEKRKWKQITMNYRRRPDKRL